ncbi:glycosyltransferase family 2 protein [Caulobacter vibrioides]|uniref:glycosyltransferase family 2 protein n=1 Tax=Caulobacter vibrioides TaxID=155892 RepID=UPI000BB4842F|nr:glycosyltransferase family 2 protein [Caulobacter vibrioides]ATC25033.1 glycosyltransferase family 2 protein [Caulobacter vibrioides]AZH13188.1 glycosyltransferase family 2 protein [Caulobacter vibrioides]PLR09812.1 glycosyltransferase family 2 protein [Caulobacter vibrioides]
MYLPLDPIASGSAAATTRPRLSLVMVVYMTGPALMESIRHALDEPRVDEFVIVDNGSSLADAAWLRDLARREPRVRLLQGLGNIGFARAANLGATAAKGDELVFLNPDAFLTPGAVAALREAARDRPSPCVVGARVFNTDGTEQRGGRRGEITPVTTLLSLSKLSATLPPLRRFEIHREGEPIPPFPVDTPTISGACFYVSARDFQRLGGFDEGYFLHVEDIDLCWRARRQGGCVLFQPHARVVHVGSTSRESPLVIEWHKGKGLVRYFLKRADSRRRKALALLLAPLILSAAVARPLLRMAHRQTERSPQRLAPITR